MGRYLTKAVLAAAYISTLVSAQQAQCGVGGLKCPESSPCCSLYNKCGVGAYCLGGCNPIFSSSLGSCVPAQVCKSQTYKFENQDDFVSIDKYLGDNSKANWVVTGKPLPYQNSGVLLTMAQDTVGTLLSSTHEVWYGKISAKMTSSQGKGVITAFIMMSGVRDEIDFEWIGSDVQHVQSNYYSQGVTNYEHGRNHSVSETQATVHTYTLDWKPDELIWSIDDNVVRTLKRSETWNSTANRFDYPQTPAKVMLSLWPAGLPSNGQGTIDWAGGLIDWNSPHMKNGYYYAMVQEVSIQCYDPPKGAQVKTSDPKSYIYTDVRGTNDTVALVDKQVTLASLYATGDNPGTDPNAKNPADPSKTGTAAPVPTDVETVPGMSGGGNRETENQPGNSNNQGEGQPSGNGNPSSNNNNNGGGQTFSQGGSSGAAALRKERKVGGSIFAVCVALVALFML